MADSLGVRIQQVGREEALRKIYQMKGLSPPKPLFSTSPPKSSPRKGSDGAYRVSLYDDAMSMVHKAQGESKRAPKSCSVRAARVPFESPATFCHTLMRALQKQNHSGRLTTPRYLLFQKIIRRHR